jgi:WXG100 family type VII secretion target
MTMSMKFDAVQQAIDDTIGCHNALVEEKEGLERFLSDLGAEWYGSDANAYQDTKNKWNAACDDVNGILADLLTRLQEAHHTFKGTAHGLEQLWSS